MFGDLLVGQRCPQCGCPGLHPEAGARCVDRFTNRTSWPDAHTDLITETFVAQCGVCGWLWSVCTTFAVIPAGEVRKWASGR
jgi:hypothetical protein